MDAIELLSHDHRMVEQLFRDYSAAASDAQRRGVVEVLIRELSKHAALEELMFYPLAKRVLPDGDAVISRRLDRHAAVKRQLIDLDRQGEGDGRTDGAMATLREVVTAHVREDEDELMPRLRRELDEQALAELGAELDEAKQKAPTRPHPLAPDEPPLLALAAPVAAIYDRLRDRLQGRPRT